MDKKWLIIGLAIGALFLIPKKKLKARNRIKALSGWVENEKNAMETMSIDQLHKIQHETSNYVRLKEYQLKDAYKEYNNMKRGEMRRMLASTINTETYLMNQKNEIAKHAENLIYKYYIALEEQEKQSKQPKQLTLFGSKRMDGIPKKEQERLDSMKNYYMSFMPEHKAYWKAMDDLGYTHGDCHATEREAKQAERQYKNAMTVNEGGLCYHVYYKPNIIPALSEISLSVKKRCSPDITTNKIRCRVQQPKEFNKFFTRASTTPGVRYVMGMKDGKGILQSVMFDNCIWNLPQAKHWFNKNITRLLDRDKKTLNLMDIGKGKMHSEDYFSPKQQDLFPRLRRELVLEMDEPVKEESIFKVEPLEKCLERKGWQLNKARELQNSISAKMTVDMFGKTEKLTGAEVTLQEQIDECLKRLRKNEPEPKALFGIKKNLGQLWKEDIEKNFGKTLTTVVKQRVYGKLKPLSKPLVSNNSQLPDVRKGYTRIYHGTSIDNLESIDKKGILFGKDVGQKEKLNEILFSINPNHKWGDIRIAVDVPTNDKRCWIPDGKLGDWGTCTRRIPTTEIVGYVKTNILADSDDASKAFLMYKKSILRALDKGYKVPVNNLKFFNLEG